jgi:hypothetical protein
MKYPKLPDGPNPVGEAKVAASADARRSFPDGHWSGLRGEQDG